MNSLYDFLKNAKKEDIALAINSAKDFFSTDKGKSVLKKAQSGTINPSDLSSLAPSDITNDKKQEIIKELEKNPELLKKLSSFFKQG